MSGLWVVSYIILWVIIAGLAVVSVGLLRQLGLIQMRIGTEPGVLMTPEGLSRGAEAPDFEAFDIRTHRPVRLSASRGRRVLLVFMETGCSACRDLAPHLNAIARAYRDEVDTLVVCQGDEATCREFARQTDLHSLVLADPTKVIAAQYEVGISPLAFLIDAEGTILIRGVTNSWPHLEALLKEEGTFQKSSWQRVETPSTAAAQDGMGEEEVRVAHSRVGAS